MRQIQRDEGGGPSERDLSKSVIYLRFKLERLILAFYIKFCFPKYKEHGSSSSNKSVNMSAQLREI